ncbi:MAG: phosphoadenylyl-sulfate reductase [Boseongicola sp.]|nr:phosphoadenylyl-sulfate reductase [Boseongicola sp.]
MPLEAPLPPVEERVDELNKLYAHHSASSVVEHAIGDPLVGKTVLLSSFGAESIVLLHMVSVIDRTTPILFLDTEMLFPETLDYQREVAAALRLTNVQVFGPDRDLTFVNDANSRLHVTNPDACCALRKTEPMQAALAPYDAWITGRKRVQGGKRAKLRFFEADGKNRMKINPLAHFSKQDVEDYLQNNRLPRHPLVAKGYASIGCAPCTTKVAPGEDARAGRWRGLDKSECGIHVVNGQTVRSDLET